MMYELRDFGFSSAVGIGGDPIIGTTHIDCLEAFENDPDTDAIVMIGEIGGDAEERAAAYIKDHVTKPVVGYVAGFTAPEGKTMGHAGAIVSGSSGTAAAKQEALEAAGVKVGKTPSETADLMREIMREGDCRSRLSRKGFTRRPSPRGVAAFVGAGMPRGLLLAGQHEQPVSSAKPCCGSPSFVMTTVDTAPAVFWAVTPTHSVSVGLPSRNRVEPVGALDGPAVDFTVPLADEQPLANRAVARPSCCDIRLLRLGVEDSSSCTRWRPT